MTSYTPSLRLWQGTPFDLAIRGAWGTPLNTNDNLLEAAILGTTTISVTGLATLTLSTVNGGADQARNLVQQYTGALTVDCTILLPNVPKFGYARNSTTGGRNIILNAGAGSTATIPPDGQWHFYWADGATNVILPGVVYGSGAISGTTAAFSDLVTINSVAGIAGTHAGDNATPGSIGEYISGTVAAPGITLTSNVTAQITFLVLGAGDWDVGGHVAIHVAAEATVLQGWASQSATAVNTAIPTNTDNRTILVNGSGAPIGAIFPVPTIRVNSSAPSTFINFCANAIFSGGLTTASGTVWARRAR